MDFRWICCNLSIFLLLLLLHHSTANATGIFPLHHKFKGRDHSISDLKNHDSRRHSRILADIDLPLGGNGDPTDAGLYYAKIGIGTPSIDYYVQVDTGSDIFWVNCIECSKCPEKSGLGVDLKLYNPKASISSKIVTCDQDFCSATYEGGLPGCTSNTPCEYRVVYGDGSSTDGYFVNDLVQYNRASGNLLTMPSNATVTFGCGAKQSGDLGTSSGALDGLLGFGQANSSMISQLASTGKVKKMFAHCLDGIHGGGIFAIGHVMQPKVKMTPLVPNQPHYNVNMKAIEVGKTTLQLPTDVFETGDGKGTIIDSGTTLAYLPEVVYEPLMTAILSHQSDLKLSTVENQFQCFQYIGSVDDGFPTVTFHFEKSVPLMVYPHDYLFLYREDIWCIGWQNGGLQSKDGKDTILLGDLALSDKLVVYDLENQAIGWMDFNCSSSIKMQDEQTKEVYQVNAHNISSACCMDVGRFGLLLLLVVSLLMYNLIH